MKLIDVFLIYSSLVAYPTWDKKRPKYSAGQRVCGSASNDICVSNRYGRAGSIANERKRRRKLVEHQNGPVRLELDIRSCLSGDGGVLCKDFKFNSVLCYCSHVNVCCQCKHRVAPNRITWNLDLVSSALPKIM
eukprot:6472778-Amphidinium_carterae.1